MATPTIGVALVGQPNVGKSSLFTRMTGVGVISSNYPGTTVEFEEATVKRNDTNIHVFDLPGTYSLAGNSSDEDVTVRMLTEHYNDAIVVVADATNLSGSLVLCFEVMELGFPTILALNKYDQSIKRYDINHESLSKLLGIPVVPVSAKTAEGVDELMDNIREGKAVRSNSRVRYSDLIESGISTLEEKIPSTTIDKRGLAVKLLEGVEEYGDFVSEEIVSEANSIRNEIQSQSNESVDISIGRDRYALSDVIVRKIQTRTARKLSFSEKLSDVMITPSTGIPILLAVFSIVFLSIIYLGAFLDGLVADSYAFLIGDHLTSLGQTLGGDWEILIKSINDSISAILALLVGYIMVFYIILGILEDSGYLTRAVVLLDRVMHRFGLHGGAFIPMMVGIGCNVPAIMATRTIQSKRERLILVTLIVMAVPCSAQIAIIMGVTGVYAGVQYSLMILLTLLLLIILLGIGMNKFLKPEPSNLALELPNLMMPQMKNVLFKTWERVKDFFIIAFPLLVIGSIIIEFLLEYDVLYLITDPLSFITVGLLGLPAVTIIAFVVGILRKEMAYALLIILAGDMTLTEFMTPEQFVIFGMVMAVFMPCLATASVMWKEFGWKGTLIVSLASIGVAILLGSLYHLFFILF